MYVIRKSEKKYKKVDVVAQSLRPVTGTGNY